MTIPAASARGISKHFGATRALDNVDFDVLPGELHALVGENGAGKSTLVRILGGVHRPDQGEVTVDGRICRFNGPRDAIAAGIVTIPQELRLVPTLSIAENLTLGDPPVRRILGLQLIDRARMRKEAQEQLAQLDFAPDPDLRVDRLSFAERQLVAIAKALRRRCRVLVLDEPTAALETREIERLFAVLARMKSQGTAIIYVSHRLDEVVALGDRCTVLRDGRVAAASRRGAFNVTDLVEAMTGRTMAKADAEASAARCRAARRRRRSARRDSTARQRGDGPRRPPRQRHRPRAAADIRARRRSDRPAPQWNVTADRKSGDGRPHRHRLRARRAAAGPHHESFGTRQHSAAQPRPAGARRPHRPRQRRPFGRRN